MTNWSGKVVLITGGRNGIGRACAEQFSKVGATVVTAQRGLDDQHACIETDLLQPQAAEELISNVISKFGRLDVLINNAGLMREGTVVETSEQDWADTIQLNLTAPFMLTRHAMPHLIKTSGCIINVGSIEGLGSNPRHPAYCASKAGLHGLTRAVAVDHGKDGVRCNAIAPGWIDTEFNEAFIEEMDNPSDFRRQIGDIHPVGRTGKPEEIASLAVWLGSDEASFVTGQVWTVDGGRTSQLSLP